MLFRSSQLRDRAVPNQFLSRHQWKPWTRRRRRHPPFGPDPQLRSRRRRLLHARHHPLFHHPHLAFPALPHVRGRPTFLLQTPTLAPVWFARVRGRPTFLLQTLILALVWFARVRRPLRFHRPCNNKLAINTFLHVHLNDAIAGWPYLAPAPREEVSPNALSTILCCLLPLLTVLFSTAQPLPLLLSMHRLWIPIHVPIQQRWLAHVTKPVYVTTPIYYVNGPPHIGHAFTSVLADCLARAARLAPGAPDAGSFLLTGTDEHGVKVADAAKAAGAPSTIAFCDSISQRFRCEHRRWRWVGGGGRGPRVPLFLFLFGVLCMG